MIFLGNNIAVKRLIQLKSKIPFVMAEMAQTSIVSYKNLDNRIDPMAYAEAKLLSYITDKTNLKLENFSEMEQIEYKRALEHLKDFREMDYFCTYTYEVYKLVQRLYTFLVIDISQSNFMAFNPTTSDQYVEYLEKAMDEYGNLMEAVKHDKDWTEKIENEIGSYWSQIHSLHSKSPKLEKILNSHNFDREFFFK